MSATAKLGAIGAALAAALLLACLAAAPAAAVNILSFDSANTADEIGNPFTQAGGRPHENVTSFELPTTTDPKGNPVGEVDVKDIEVDLPPGFVGNPLAYPRCTVAQLAIGACPSDTQIGVVHLLAADGSTADAVPLYNMLPGPGQPALFGFDAALILVFIHPEVRADGTLTVVSRGISQLAPTVGVTTEFWGVPSADAHNAERQGPGCESGCESGIVPDKPFLALPTSCGEAQRTDLRLTAWREPGVVSTASVAMPANTDCDQLQFEPTLSAHPTTNVADFPTGLEVDLGVPQSEDATRPATAHLRDAVVTLPEGLTVNPASANGLDGCSPTEVGIDANTGVPADGPANCPNASKIATVEVDTPLIDHPVPGAVYLADPYDNPFNSLIAIYIALDDPGSGLFVKLAGEVSPNPDTGQLQASFEDNPPVPFTNFHLEFFSGPAAPLKTPATCGDYTTTSSLTPYSAPDSGPPQTPSDAWEISQGPGGPCANTAAELPNAPSFDAGTVSPISKAFSPFVVHLRREDGSQNFSALNISPPQGLVAKLAGTAICSDAELVAAAQKSGAGEKANPSCPAASRVGSVIAAAGAGPAPYHAPGTLYMAGPYKGAPLSFAAITPATAGPFDLGTIVVRAPIHIDPKTAQVSTVTDPIPSILQGIPLDVRTLDIALDRPEFTLTGTSCDPLAVSGLLTSTLGQLASLSSRFQLSDCTRLAFKPRMSLRLRGGTKRGKHPALTATIMPRPGDANIAAVSVAFPKSEFLENAHIRTVCTRPDFAADACPKGAIYGTASVTTPILDYPLRGNVYLRSSDNLLPDLVTDLRGPAHQPIKLETAGRTDSIGGGIRNTFDFIPDAPFTKAVVALQGGNKGLLVNSRDICDRVYRATVKYTAHNGKTHTARPALKAKCPKKGKSAKKGKRGKGKRIAHRSAVR